MTKYLKSRSTHIIVKCILGIIILSLILSTMNSYVNQDLEKYVATVNGEKISFKIFKNMYALEKEKQKKILGKNFFKFSKNKQFIQETYNYILSQLINNVLLEQYAKKMQLQVDDYKIKEIILNSPIFQKNNKFNQEQYFNYLASINLTNHEYINIIKTKINTENLIHTISSSNFILEKEQKHIIKLLSQKRMIKKSIFKINSIIKKQKITNLEAKNYFYKHRNNFYIPEKFKISFIKLNVNDFKTKSNNAEISQWYLKNIKKYSTKEKRRYSVIQIKTKNEALLISSQLYNTPEDFSKIAKEKSIDPISSKKGGDIGWISIDLIPNEIQNANLNKKNQISNIIPFGDEFLIVKLDEILYGTQNKISEVYNIIKKEIKNKKSLNLYHKLQNKISDFIKKNPNQFDLLLKEKNISAIFKENNISTQETNWFDKNSIPEKLNIPILKKIIFDKNLVDKNKKIKSQLNFIVLKNNQSFLVNIKDFQNKKIQDFTNAKKDVIKQLKFIKSVKEINEKSKKILYELKKGNTNLFKQSNLYFNDSEVISRYDDNPISSIVFSLPHPQEGEKIYTLYQDKNKNCIIILLEKIYNSNFSQKENDIIIEYLEKNNTEVIFNSILKNLREKSKITYEKITKI